MSWIYARSFRPTLSCLEDRITPSAGALDPSFGVGGLVRTRFPSPSNDLGRSTAIDSLGRIVLAAETHTGSSADFAVIRYTSAGALDTSFGGTGIVTISFGAGDDFAFGVAVDSLDRVIVAGEAGNGPNYDFAVARLTVAGALDTSFDGDGKRTIGFGVSGSAALGVSIDSQNRVVLAGFTSDTMNTIFAVARLTVSGALDGSFDGDGKQTISFGAFENLAYGVAVDSLDRVVVAGYAGPNGAHNFAVARLTTTGALDTGFDGDGKQTIAFGSDNQACGMAVDSLDRIVIAGNAYVGSTLDFAVCRLTAAGALDSSFDDDGRQTIDFGTANELAYGVTVDSLNRVVVAGYTFNGSSDVFAAARVTAAGALDNSFDGDGRQTIAFGPDDDEAYGVAVDASDRIVITGSTSNGTTYDIATARLTAGGALDSSFDGDGRQTLGLTNQSIATGQAVAVDSLGRVVVAGFASDGVKNDFAVARYTSAGALDITFGGAGVVRFAFGTSNDVAYGVAVDSLNRVVVVGGTRLGSFDDIAVARLSTAGALDPTFDGDGKQTITFSTNEDIGYAVDIDSLGRIVVAGIAYNGSNYDFAVARLTTAGALDTNFDGDGKQTIAFGTGDDFAYGVAIDSLDRIVVAGETSNGSNTDFAVARLTASGALDNSFDGDGKQTVAFGSFDDKGNSVAVDSLDRIVVAGYSRGPSNFDFAVARLTTSGALDGSFDGDGRQTIAFGPNDEYGYAVAVDSLNRTVVAGYTLNGSNTDFAVARLTVAGALDSGFDGDGKQTIDFGGYEHAYGIAVDSADRVIVVGNTDYNSRDFALARLTGDTTTATAQVNDGSVQRSRVTSLTVRFSGQVTFSGSPDQAFTLVRTGGGAVSFTATVSVQNGGTVVLLDHFTGSETEFGSLADGRYTLTALASQISANGQALDGDSDGVAGGNFVFGDTQGLFRLFGDVNGDQTVNGFDLGFFRNSFGTAAGDPNYLSYLDINGDGVINGFDLGQFRTRFGTMLP